MINALADRSQGVLNRPAGGGKSAQNAKKILNRGNEPKNLLKANELAFSGAQNEPNFQAQKPQSKLRIGLRSDDLRGLLVKMGIGKWKLENRKWQLETRKWTLENGDEESGVAISSFEFPVSIFEFRISIFEFRVPTGRQVLQVV
jgi:hypothetical protein